MSSSNFIVARYSTKGSSSLYTGYGMGPVGLFVAAVTNPHSGYRELVGGVVTNLTWKSQAVTLAVAAADASDGLYLQTYAVPSFVLGVVQLSRTVEWYEPLERSGVRQLEVNPVTVAFSLNKRVRLGVAYTLSLAEDAASSQRAGAVVQVGIPRGQLYVEVLQRVGQTSREVRLGCTLGF